MATVAKTALVMTALVMTVEMTDGMTAGMSGATTDGTTAGTIVAIEMTDAVEQMIVARELGTIIGESIEGMRYDEMTGGVIQLAGMTVDPMSIVEAAVEELLRCGVTPRGLDLLRIERRLLEVRPRLMHHHLAMAMVLRLLLPRLLHLQPR